MSALCCNSRKDAYFSSVMRSVFCFKLPLFAVLSSCFLLVFTVSKAQSSSYVVVDFHSGFVLNSFAAEQRQPIASLTKVATACVVLDWAERTGYDLASQIVVPAGATLTGGANPLQLRPGDRISLRDALYAALMASDNVAALTLANAVGADIRNQRGLDDEPIVTFVREMNALAISLGMENTWFCDPHGLGDPNSNQSVSTASDLARLTISALGRASLRFYVSQHDREITIFRPQGRQSMLLRNTNQLLGQDGVDGVKTGMTSLSGPCLIASAPRDALRYQDAQGQEVIMPRRLVVVVLNSPNRFGEAHGLLQQGWSQFDYWVAQGRPITDATQMLSVPAN